jgi:hypothetical protein
MKLRMNRAYAMQIGLRVAKLIFAFIKIFVKGFETLSGYLKFEFISIRFIIWSNVLQQMLSSMILAATDPIYPHFT